MPSWLVEMPGWEVVMIIVAALLIAVTLTLRFTGKIGNRTFEGMSFVLAALAIAFAIIQFSDAREHTHSLQSIHKSVSTRYIGAFPKNLADINEVVAAADKQLDIMVDFVGYGHYSAPTEFEKYKRKIEDLSQRDVLVRILVYEQQKAREVHDTQFTKERFEEASGAKTGNPDPKFVAFCKNFNQGVLPKTKAEFDELLFRKQQNYMVDLLGRGVKIKKTTTELPFYLWNEDDEDAVFSFLNADNKGDREVSFRTRESNIVKGAFKRRFEALWEHSADVHLTYTQGTPRIDW